MRGAGGPTLARPPGTAGVRRIVAMGGGVPRRRGFRHNGAPAHAPEPARKAPMPEPGRVRVHLLPDLVAPGALRGGVAVVLDVLRATTVMVHALDAGCEAVLPCLEVDDARRVAAELPVGKALLGGERLGLPIEGFDLGNSPSGYTPEVCRGRSLVMTTTNGTRALLACLEAERVLVAGFVNLGATLRVLGDDPRPVHLVASGTDGRISFEDGLLAGALADGLGRGPSGRRLDDDPALLAAAAWRETCRRLEGGEALAARLLDGRGGRRVRELGLVGDVEDAARLDRFDFAAEVRRDPLRVVRLG